MAGFPAQLPGQGVRCQLLGASASHLSPAEPAHHLQDALLADEDAFTAQLSVDPAVAVPSFMPLEAFLHELLEGLALYLGVRLSSPQVLVVARFGDSQRFAGLLDGAEFAPVLLQEVEPDARS